MNIEIIVSDKAFKKALKGVGADMKDLTAVHRELADYGVKRARAVFPSSKMGALIKRKATQTEARVQLIKGARQGWYGGVLEFGGSVPWRSKSGKPVVVKMADGQFRTMKGALIKQKPAKASGYFIYPELRSRYRQYHDMYQDGMRKLAHKYGLNWH